MKSSYFWLAVVLIGSMGVWLPACQDYDKTHTLNLQNISPNLGTYYLPIIFGGCFDYFLSKFQKIRQDGIGQLFLGSIWILLGTAFSFYLLNRFHNQGDEALALFIGLAGVIGSWFMWWHANEDNPNFKIESNSETGGPANKPLINGK